MAGSLFDVKENNDSDFASDRPVVSTQWLEDHLGDRGIVVLDASVFLDPPIAPLRVGEFRSGLDHFQNDGHILTARFADLFTEFSNPDSSFPFIRPTYEQFEGAAGRLGITADTHVVIYDKLVGQWASRLWWVFRNAGHPYVSILDGGYRKYVEEGRVIRKGPPAPYIQTKYIGAGERVIVATEKDVLDVVERRRRGRLVCLLQPEDFAGIRAVGRRPGHIPGSVNLPFTKLLNESDNTFKSQVELKELFASIVPLSGDLIITYCGGGVASTLGALALAIIGYENTLEYDGALVEWASNPIRPLALLS